MKEDGSGPGRAPMEAIRDFYRKSRLSRLGVAVSGGSDSLALLHLLYAADVASLSVVTLDHGLRPEAEAEAREVERVCRDLHLPHVVLEWEGWDGRGNLMAEARAGRYRRIAEWARGQGLDAVALGHTRDDQAETFLMRLAREAGVGGLAAMKDRFERDGMEFHRPLLGVSRAALRDWLTKKGAAWVEDPTNDDESFQRVRARRALQALSPLGLTPEALATVADQLRDADHAIARAAADWAGDNLREEAGDLVIERAGLLALPRETCRRILADGILWVAGGDYPPRRDAISGLRPAIRGSLVVTLGGCLLSSGGETLRISREAAAVSGSVARPGDLWDGRWRLTGPALPGAEVRALGVAVKDTPWRDTGLPRASLMASPALWQGDALLSAPVAGLAQGYRAEVTGRDTFARFLLSR